MNNEVFKKLLKTGEIKTITDQGNGLNDLTPKQLEEFNEYMKNPIKKRMSKQASDILIASGKISEILNYYDGDISQLSSDELKALKEQGKKDSEAKLEAKAMKIAASPGYQEMMLSPILSKIMAGYFKQNAKRNTETDKEDSKPEGYQYNMGENGKTGGQKEAEEDKPAGEVTYETSKKETTPKPEPKESNSDVQPIQNVQEGDSELEILQKMYGFIKDVHESKNETHKQDVSNKKKIMDDQTRRSDELIGLFTGKKKKRGKKAKTEKVDKKKEEEQKKKPTAKKETPETTTPTKAVPTAIKVATAAAAGGAALVGIDALAAKITKNEGGGNPNQANIVKGTSRKEADIVKGNIDVTTGQAFDKSLEQMTLGEAYDLGTRRGKHYNQKGAGAAMGKYGFMPIAIKDRGMALYGNEWRSMPFDSKTQDELNKSLIINNLQKLQKAGIPPSERNLYLMHFFGNTNQTSAFLNSSDDAKMGPILDMYNNGATANPDVARLTVGEYKSRFLAKFDNTPAEIEKQEMKAIPTPIPKQEIPEKMKSDNGENKSTAVVSKNNTNVYNGGTTYNIQQEKENNNSPLVDKQYGKR